MKSSIGRLVVLVLAAFTMCSAAFGSSLVLGSDTAVPGATVSLPLTLTKDTALASMEWSVSFNTADITVLNVVDGPAATQAGKTIQCYSSSPGTSKCVLAGANASELPAGVVASVNVTVSPTLASASTPITIAGAAGATVQGDAASVSASAGALNILHAAGVKSLSCSPTSLLVTQTATCTVTLTKNAPAGGAVVKTGVASVGPVTANVPVNITVPAGSAVGTFAVNVSGATASSNLVVIATLNEVSRSASIAVFAPSISLTPASASLGGGQTMQFTAAVSNVVRSAGVVWTVTPAVGTISSTGLYTAPAVIGSSQVVSVKATSVSDATKSAVSTITLVPVSVAISPATKSMAAGQQQQFTASVKGLANTAVTWSVSPAVGTISAAGLYTAPTTVTTTQTVSVRATSVADTTKFAVATLAVSPAPVTPPLGQDVVASWAFSEGSGTVTADQSGNGRIGKLLGATWTTGYTGSGLLFNGSTSYVDAGAFDVSGNVFTISTWFKATTIPNTDPRIISKATGAGEQDHYWMLSLTESGGSRLRFRLKAGGTTRTLVADGQTVPAGQWVHAVATYNGATMRLYQNGVEVGSIGASGLMDSNASAPVSIGSNPNMYGVFNGAIDEVRLYKRALSSTEVQALYKAK